MTLRRLLLPVCMAVLVVGSVSGTDGKESIDRKREATLLYGIESQVIELIGTLKSEKNRDFDATLLSLLRDAGSPKLRAAILDFFAAAESDSAEDMAAEFIRKRDSFQDSLVLASFTYLTRIRSVKALDQARMVIEDDERRYLQASIRMLGKAGTRSDAAILVKLYENESGDPAVKNEVLLAFGELKAVESYELLARLVEDENAGKAERMQAVKALGLLGDGRAVAILERSANSGDPNVRSVSIDALASFDDARARGAIVNALRDSHVLVRTAGAKAAAILVLAEAVPALEYKVESDPEKSVRDASIAALAAIATPRAWNFLSAFAREAKNPSQHRIKAFSEILDKGDGRLQAEMLALFIENDTEKEKAFYLALARAALLIDGERAAPFALRLYGDKDHAVRLAAVAWAERCRYKAHKPELLRLSEGDPSDMVKRRASSALDKLSAD